MTQSLMLDPLVSAAFSVYSRKGATALLLGSGISRAAGIPTGWEIVLDLIRKLAAAYGDEPVPDPEAWYIDKFTREPSYSELLQSVAKTSTERQQLLCQYFEPTNEERDAGKKIPTRAHRAVADLMRDGFIRVVITTNFDKLLEQALDACGTTPRVISTADSAKGALPLIHAGPTIIKLHGDYLDPRILNTQDELAEYSPEMNRLIDRVFDEFGLVVCGWSAQWDIALVQALERCPTRRFSTYWTTFGGLGDRATSLVAARDAQVITITGSNAFFEVLWDKATALDASNAAHPLSRPVAVATVKRLLSDDRHQIALRDFVSQEAQELVKKCKKIESDAATLTEDQYIQRLAQYEQASDILIGVFGQLGRWARGKALEFAREALRIVGSKPELSYGNDSWSKLRLYPCLLLCYAAGVSAVHAENWATVQTLWKAPLANGYEDLPCLHALFPGHIVESDACRLIVNGYAPVSELVFRALKGPLQDLIPLKADYEQAFNRFELFWCLEEMHKSGNGFRIGRYLNAMPRQVKHEDNRPIQELLSEATQAGESWPPLSAGLFGGSIETLKSVALRFCEQVHTLHR